MENVQSTMARFVAVNWIQALEIAQTHFALVWSHVLQCLDTHQEVLIAPLLWLLISAVVLHWLPNVIATPPESDPKEIPTRRHRCALKQHHSSVSYCV